MRIKLNRKGQITIPKSIRDQFVLEPGAEIDITVSDWKVITIAKVQPPRGPVDFKALRGCLNLGMTTDEFMFWLRGDPDV
jgi:AbrB family looped-hinge helix DNA binding protein